MSRETIRSAAKRVVDTAAAVCMTVRVARENRIDKRMVKKLLDAAWTGAERREREASPEGRGAEL